MSIGADVGRASSPAIEARRRRDTTTVSTAVRLAAPAGRRYPGLVTRALAFALDAAVVNGCALVIGVVVGLGLSILHLPERADVVIAAVMGGLWVIWTVGYFAFFWSTTGQTPGNRVCASASSPGGAGGASGQRERYYGSAR
jgi:hypothetical protein